MKWANDELHQLVAQAQHALKMRRERCVTGRGEILNWTSLDPVVQLLERFQGLLRSVALRYRKTFGFDEAYQEASFAFLTTIATYDVQVGPFPAYAARKVRGDVYTAMRREWRIERRREVPVVYEGETADEAMDRVLRESVGGDASDVGAPGSSSGLERSAWSGSLRQWVLLEDLCTLIRKSRLSTRETAWVKWFLAGYRQEEIALLCGVSTETVKTWRKRCLRKLRLTADTLGMSAHDFR